MCVISEPVVWTDPFSQQERAYVVAQVGEITKGVFVMSEDVGEDDFKYYLLHHLQNHAGKAAVNTGTLFSVCGVTFRDETTHDHVRFNHILSESTILDKTTIAGKLCSNSKYYPEFKDFINKLSKNVDPENFVCMVVKYR